VQRTTGGYSVPGKAVLAGDNRVLPGTLAFVGPEAFFLSDAGGPGAVLRRQSGATYPAAYALPAWSRADAEAFFRGQAGHFEADASRGKALHLQETKGSVLSHIRSGGVVAYIILATGLLALLLIVQKLYDLAQMKLDRPDKVQALLDAVAAGNLAEADRKLAGLHRTTHEIFAAGLRYRDRPKALLEEQLQSLLHRQQMHFERRLSLLAVIATAAPLMGLLGTVSGMVKTFALMTVFGSGNAMKLSAGISEVLVATELGLMVAIPALVVHGFLSHRIRKNLSLLEHYAMEFVIALDQSRAGPPPASAQPAGHEGAR
jgi:biopolymer transport protein ExbB